MAHRLKLAGCEREIFTSDAVTLLHEASTGRLRDLDRIATDALKRAARLKIRKVDHQVLEAVLAGDDDD